MSFANFGIGLGAFSQGFAGGVQTGAALRGMKDQGDIRKAAQKGIEGAQQSREKEISGRIEQTGMDGQQGFMGEMTTGYKVGDKSFGNPEEARGQAEKGAGSVMDYFMRDAAPKIGEMYMAQGNPEKAQEWENFIQQRNTQTGMRHWASAMRSAQMGDMDGFATALEQAYNTPGYMDDGIRAKGHKINDDGSIEMTFDRDGKEFTQTFAGSEDIVQAGIGLLSPQAAFEIHQAQAQSAAEARAKSAQGDREHQQKLELEGVKVEGRAAVERLKAQLRREYGGENGDPAAVRTAEWLIDHGVAKDAKSAWNLANMSKTQGRQEFALEYAKMVSDSISGMREPPEDAIQRGLEVYDTLQQESAPKQDEKGGSDRPERRGLGIDNMGGNTPPMW